MEQFIYQMRYKFSNKKKNNQTKTRLKILVKSQLKYRLNLFLVCLITYSSKHLTLFSICFHWFYSLKILFIWSFFIHWYSISRLSYFLSISSQDLSKQNPSVHSFLSIHHDDSECCKDMFWDGLIRYLCPSWSMLELAGLLY